MAGSQWFISHNLYVALPMVRIPGHVHGKPDPSRLLAMVNTHRFNGAAIYGAPWIPSIYPSYVSIYTSTMDPMGNG